MVGEAVEEGPGELQFSGVIVYRKGSGTGEPVLDLGQVLELANPLSQYNQGGTGGDVLFSVLARMLSVWSPCGTLGGRPGNWTDGITEICYRRGRGTRDKPSVANGLGSRRHCPGGRGYHPRRAGL